MEDMLDIPYVEFDALGIYEWARHNRYGPNTLQLEAALELLALQARAESERKFREFFASCVPTTDPPKCIMPDDKQPFDPESIDANQEDRRALEASEALAAPDDGDSHCVEGRCKEDEDICSCCRRCPKHCVCDCILCDLCDRPEDDFPLDYDGEECECWECEGCEVKGREYKHTADTWRCEICECCEKCCRENDSPGCDYPENLA